MKKTKTLLTLVTLTPFLASCGETPAVVPEHAWNWNNDGNYHWKVCSDCGIAEGKGFHTWNGGEVTTAATATAEGVKTYTCTACNAQMYESIPTTVSSHTHAWQDHYSMDVDYHFVVCNGCDDQLYKAKHDWDEGVEADGIKTYTCKICKGTKTETVIAGHTHLWGDTYESDDNAHWLVCGGCPTTKDINAHTWDKGVTTKEATESETGIKTYTCEICKRTKTEVIPKIGEVPPVNNGHKHAWNDGVVLKEATETERGQKEYTCSICNKTQIIEIPKTGAITKSQPDADSRWNLNFTEYGTTFRDSLAALITNKVKSSTTYSACLNITMTAGETSSSKYVPIYHSEAHNKSESSNREHTWPKSRGGNLIETDPFIIRASLTADNSNRGNDFYGLPNEKLFGKTYSKQWDPSCCESGFEAGRGEAARIMLYAATKYGKSKGLSLSNNPNDDTSKKTMGVLKYLVEWNRQYEPTVIEKQINNYLEDHGYGRNPFVDHPEYADYIWDINGYVSSAPTSITFGDFVSDKLEEYEEGEGLRTGYTLKDALADIDNAYILNGQDAKSMYAMTAETKGAELPWYIKGVEATVADDYSTCGINEEGADNFSFKKQSDGTYTIQSSDGKYLYGYIDGTHYSIGLEENPSKGGSKFWNITKNGKGFSFKASTVDVYLEYYNGSYCGYKSAPSTPIYLYTKDDGTTTGGTTTGGGTSTTYAYTAIEGVDNIGGSDAYIVVDSKVMTATPASDALPWYINAANADVSSDKKSANFGEDAAKYTFTKVADGKFTVKSSDGQYLYSYVDDTHYSIGLSSDVNDIKGGTINWIVTANGSGFTFKGDTTGTYLQLGSPSFCGKNAAPSTAIYLYK